MRETAIEVGGWTSRVLEAGTGPTVILVHGLGLGADVWSEHVEHLAAHGYRAVAPDLPGFGRSTGPRSGWSVQGAADWLAALARRIDAGEAAWVGHSVSAQYVLRIAADHPGLVSRVVAAAPTGEPGRFRWLAQLVGLARTARREPGALVLDVLSHYATTPPLRTVGTWAGARRSDPCRDAAQLRCPLRVVVGGRDPVVDDAFARSLADAAPNAEFVVIPDSAHGVALAPARPFLDVLLAFLDPLRSGPHTDIAALSPSPGGKRASNGG